jgi:hypothetical protein
MDEQQTKVEAVEAGLKRDAIRKELASSLINPSDIDLFPLTGLEIAQDGSVTGVADVVANVRASKGHWFKPGRNSPRISPDVKPGSKEHKEAENDFLARWSR